MACVIVRNGHQCSEEELRDFCNRELGRYKTPRVIRFVNDLPRGPSGKVQRLKLAELDACASKGCVPAVSGGVR